MKVPNSKSELKAVIFDVDGTLVDSNDFHAEAWRRAFREFGKEVTFADIHHEIGKGGDQLIPVFCTEEETERFGRELDDYRAELFENEYLDRVSPFPGVRELFERVKADGLSIALASSAKTGELERHKDNLRVKELIEAVTSADDAENSKPDPDIFEAAVRNLDGVEPQEAIVVGDSPWDAIAAGKAGMRMIGLLSGGFTETELLDAGAVEVYNGIEDLLDNYDRSQLAPRTRAA